ncbi:hypothetical protein ACPA9J_00055 [Pseudomonas aeruginosa]
MRDARNRCKRPFERIWRDKLMTRSQGYLRPARRRTPDHAARMPLRTLRR